MMLRVLPLFDVLSFCLVVEFRAKHVWPLFLRVVNNNERRWFSTFKFDAVCGLVPNQLVVMTPLLQEPSPS
jgi:hypothetical protein